MSSGWFDCTEPSLCTLLQGKQGVQGAYAIVRGGSSTSNSCDKPLHTYSCILRGFDVLEHLASPGREGSVQSNHTELMKRDSIHLSISAMFWFEKVRGCSMCSSSGRVRGGSSTSNTLEPSRTTSLQVEFELYPNYCISTLYTLLILVEKVRYSRTIPNSG